jgi:hypothetical protein
MPPIESPIHSTRYDPAELAAWPSAAPQGLSAKLSAQIGPLFLLMCLAHRFHETTAALIDILHEPDFSLGLADLVPACVSGATTGGAVNVLVVVKQESKPSNIAALFRVQGCFIPQHLE